MFSEWMNFSLGLQAHQSCVSFSLAIFLHFSLNSEYHSAICRFLLPVTMAALFGSSVASASEPRCFPEKFMFGSATASYQVEGAVKEGGRTSSIWDDFCREKPGMKCANVADDFYHRYKDDVKLMVQTGLESFRFSISWSRAMNWDPVTRRMKPNAEGIAWYHNLIDELNANGIVPILTIYHWDLPSELQTQLEPKGWLNPEIVDHFLEYSTLLFNEYGSKVQLWTTFNEPLSFVGAGYGLGMHAPGYSGSDTQAYTASRNVLLSHGKAVQKFRELKTSDVIGDTARIGIVLVSNWYYPLDPSNERDVAAAKRAFDFDFGWFLNPIVNGDYPAVMRERAGDRLPKFTTEESALLKGSYDIFMMNHYASRAITDCDSDRSNTPCSTLLPGYPADKGVDDSHLMPGTRAGVPDRFGNNYCEMFTGYPPGYLDMIRYLHMQDTTVDILLTENGWCGNDDVDNYDQLWYFKSFIEQVHKAVVEEKIPVIGYIAWSFLDNYEWGSYGPRFGMYYVNFTEQTGSPDFYEPKPTDLARIPRPSAKWFNKVATTKCLDGWSEVSNIKAHATSSHESKTSIFGIVFGFVALAAVVIGVAVVVVIWDDSAANTWYALRKCGRRLLPPLPGRFESYAGRWAPVTTLFLSWSRVMTWDPETRHMRPNPEGIAFYHALIDAMNVRGIVPILTIYHWDLPSALMHELTPKGWLSPEIVDHYVEYATIIFQEYGHKVDYWTTFNEPLAFVGYSYGTGMFAPGHKGSPTEAYTVSRNVLVAHAKAVQKFRELKTSRIVGNKARIGIVLVSAYFYPLDPNNALDVAAAKRALDFDFGWFLEPIVTGDYPTVMRERAGDRLPRLPRRSPLCSRARTTS
ncbi:Glycosyl hydrolases family 1, N-terminal conserved site [Phytophthora cactorum]|nr:Glycosyl hydrolases family 1, N-terminal conserved site [Phytophthora cactorum]